MGSRPPSRSAGPSTPSYSPTRYPSTAVGCTSRSTTHTSDSYGGAVRAFDAETGERQWRYEVGGVGAPSPVVADGTVYVSDYEGGLRAVTEDGTARWTFDVDDHGGTPTVHDGTVYLAGPTTLYALDAADGSTRWRVDCESEAATPVGTTDALYAVLDEQLTAIDPPTGKTRALGPTSG